MKKILAFIVLAVLFSCKSADGFKFEKMTYHTSPCFGRCPVYHMEIGSDKKIKLHNEAVYSKGMGTVDNTKVGYFNGTIPDSTYSKLIKELRTIGLDTVKFSGPQCCDGATQTMVIYYNGKRKYLRAMFPPQYALPLLTSLRDIYTTAAWLRTDQKFEIEYDSVVK